MKGSDNTVPDHPAKRGYPTLDLSGQLYGRLTAVRREGDRWTCLCVCGNEHTATTGSLRKGKVRSCGCLYAERTPVPRPCPRCGVAFASNVRRKYCSLDCSNAAKLGRPRRKKVRISIPESSTKEYQTWLGMRYRCKYETGYADRGLSVCERWDSYPNFLSDMGRAPGAGHAWSIDRIDNDSGYSPENCRWATPQQQNRNTRKQVGAKVTRAEAEAAGVPVSTVRSRLDRGWSRDEAFKPNGLNPESISATPIKGRE